MAYGSLGKERKISLAVSELLLNGKKCKHIHLPVCSRVECLPPLNCEKGSKKKDLIFKAI